MCSFIVDGGGSILGGNVLVTQNICLSGGLNILPVITLREREVGIQEQDVQLQVKRYNDRDQELYRKEAEMLISSSDRYD